MAANSGGEMKNAHKRWGLGAALLLVAGVGLALATPVAASAAPQSPNACRAVTRIGHIAGIVAPMGHCSKSSARQITRSTPGSIFSDPAVGTPPLIFHGGSVMMTPSTSPLVVTPIYWSPSGHTIASSYSSLINTYLGDVAAASGQNSNVFSVLNEYSGTNGQIHYSVSRGAPVNDTHALPTSGCRVASNDKTGIYADGTGYNACLDDAQIQAEVNRITAAQGLPHNLSHIYVLYLPKHVESCFNSGSTTTSANQCTINHQPSAAFCAYHSEDSSSAVYANMPYPVYQSGTGFTCGSEANFGAVESPNNNPDGDTVINPTSHEVSEAITDPDTSTGWYDSSGFEIGDECNFVFGATQGNAGALFNQTINGHHYLTQEEFSNNDFNITAAGCVPSSSAEA
jgi:hypothetical protein